MAAPRSISQILLDEHKTFIRPGGKGECPFCSHKTMSVTADDSFGKCFHPTCGRRLTLHAPGEPTLYSALEGLYATFHDTLLNQRTGCDALAYVRDTRGIAAEVIQHAMVGAVPDGYDVYGLFDPLINAAARATTARAPRGRPRKNTFTPAQQVQWLTE